MHHQYWFRSSLFHVAPREDDETNPCCYGKELALWVRSRFAERGYEPEPVIPEDWGWCVMLQRKPFMLWIGCANVWSDAIESMSPEKKKAYLPDASALLWSCFVAEDVTFWNSFYWKRLIGRGTTTPYVQRAAQVLENALFNEPRITLVEEP